MRERVVITAFCALGTLLVAWPGAESVRRGKGMGAFTLSIVMVVLFVLTQLGILGPR